MSDYIYYSEQLEKINKDGEYQPSFQFRYEGQKTNWLSLNEDSSRALVDWLPKPKPTANDLKTEVENWVNRTFNFIHLDVYSKMSEDVLYEHIESPEIDKEDFLNNYDLWDEFWKYWIEYDLNLNGEFSENETKEELEFAKSQPFENYSNTLDEFCEQSDQFEDYRNTQESDNYPMWNTTQERSIIYSNGNCNG